MSDVTPTMRNVDHKTPASISIDSISVQQNTEEMARLFQKFLDNEAAFNAYLEELLKTLNKPAPTPVVHLNPEIKLPDRIHLQAPVLKAEIPELHLPKPDVHVVVNALNKKMTLILMSLMVTQLVTAIIAGVLCFRSF